MKPFFYSRFGRVLASAITFGNIESCDKNISAPEPVDIVTHNKQEFSHTVVGIYHDRKRGKELFDKEELIKREFFFVLQKMDLDLVRPSLPEDMKDASDQDIIEYLKQAAIGLSLRIEDMIEDRRFANDKEKARYFDALLDESRKKKIVHAIKSAARCTGVPEEVLLGIGLIESRWNQDAERKDTEVYGPMQMKLSTAQTMAKRINGNQLRFGKQEIEINKPKDLQEDIDTAVLLAAEYLRKLYLKYGQWGLAVAAYSSGEGALDAKIKAFFPEIEFGAGATQKRENHSKALTKLKEERRKYQEQLLHDPDNTMIKKMIEEINRQWRAHNEGYARHNAEEQKAANNLPEELARHGVCAQTLCMKDEESSDDEKHSLQYPLMLDTLIRIALPYYKAP